MTNARYDFLFCLLPVPKTHAHHKAAIMLALRTVQSLPQNQRPIVMGCNGSSLIDTTTLTFDQLKNYTEIKVEGKKAVFSFGETVSFRY